MKSIRFVLCFAAILFTLTIQSVTAQTATKTTLAVTSGGSAVTEVPAMTVVTLTATVKAGGAAVQLGTVNFCDTSAKSCSDIHLLGTAQLTKPGTAVMKFRPGPGSHSYKAVFLGTKSNAGSASSPAALTVTVPAATGVYPTTTSIAQSGDLRNYILTATVSGIQGIPSPTGTVSFVDTSDGNSVRGTATLDVAPQGFRLLNSQNVSSSSYTFDLGMTEADFNNDGILDIAVTNLVDGPDVTVLLGNGDGTFAAKWSVDACFEPGAMAVADFNGDGIPDLAVACAPEDTVNIYLGNGDGTFAFKSSSGTGDWPNSITVADFNGDGKLDMVIANASIGGTVTPYLTVLLGNGDGTFTAGPNVPAFGKPGSVSVGDFNGDGIPDLAFSNSYRRNNSVSILFGNGDGTFTAVASPAIGDYGGGVLVGDFNNDGKLDLAVSNQGYSEVLTLLLGNGDGTFTAAPASPMTFSKVAGGICPGDFNGDGILDLAAMSFNNSYTMIYLLGNGDGTFTPTDANPPLTGAPQPCMAGDFNGDGISDLAFTQAPDSLISVAVWLAMPQTATATASGISVVGGSGKHQVAAVYAGDVDHLGSTSATLPLTPVPPPFGSLEAAIDATTLSTTIAQADNLAVSGWAVDPSLGAPVSSVSILIDGNAVGNATLGLARPDVAAKNNNSADVLSGWTFTYPAAGLSLGTHTVQAVAYDSYGASAPLFAAGRPAKDDPVLSFTVAATPAWGPPLGFIDSVTDAATNSNSVAQADNLLVSGWAVDAHDNAPVSQVQILIDGNPAGNATLNIARPDVARNNNAWLHAGWTFTYAVSGLSVGNHTASAVVKDSLGSSTTLKSKSFTVATTQSFGPPFGAVDQAVDAATLTTTVSQADNLLVTGWAADAHDGSPVSQVQILIDGTSVGNATLGLKRPDVAQKRGSAYLNSGWTFTYAASGLSLGDHTIEAVATDSLDNSTTLAYRAITVTQ